MQCTYEKESSFIGEINHKLLKVMTLLENQHKTCLTAHSLLDI